MLKYAHLLTVILIAAKLLALGGAADLSWWAVFTPSIVSVAIGIVLLVLGLAAALWLSD